MENFIERMMAEQNLKFEEANIVKTGGADYWHSAILTCLNQPVSGGFGASRKRARIIAASEFLERSKFKQISAASSRSREAWGLNIIPTACGFAAGFDSNNTSARSFKEAVERWTMSQWIDNERVVTEIEHEDVLGKLSPAAVFFASQFQSVRFFKKEVVVDIGNRLVTLTIGFTMGLTEFGIFPGSSALAGQNVNWEHALLESFRHQLILRNNQSSPNSFPINRVRYFGLNKSAGMSAICNAQRNNWPIPKVAFHRAEPQLGGKYFIARTILNGWQSWHEGGETRFVY